MSFLRIIHQNFGNQKKNFPTSPEVKLVFSLIVKGHEESEPISNKLGQKDWLKLSRREQVPQAQKSFFGDQVKDITNQSHNTLGTYHHQHGAVNHLLNVGIFCFGRPGIHDHPGLSTSINHQSQDPRGVLQKCTTEQQMLRIQRFLEMIQLIHLNPTLETMNGFLWSFRYNLTS